MTTPATTISISNVHTELNRTITYRVEAYNGSYGVRYHTNTSTGIRFYMISSGSYGAQLDTYLGTPFRLQENEPVVYNTGVGAVSNLVNGTTYYIRDITVIGQTTGDHQVYFRLATTPGGSAILGSTNATLTAGNITFTRPLSSVSLGDPKLRYLASQATGAVSMSNMRSKTRSNLNVNSAWSYSVNRRRVTGWELIYTGTGGILTRCPAYYREQYVAIDEFSGYWEQSGYNFDSTDFYVSYASGAIDSRASYQQGTLYYVIDFSYNTYYVDPAWSKLSPIPFIQPAGYSTNYPNNDPAGGFPTYASPYNTPYFNQMINATTSGSGTSQYTRGLMLVGAPLAASSRTSVYQSWSNTNCLDAGSGDGYIGFWNTNRLMSGTHMLSITGEIQPIYGRGGNEAEDAVRFYGCYLGLYYGV